MCAAAGNVKYFLLPVSPTNQIASLKEASLAHSFTSAPLDIVASMWLRCSSTLVRLLRVTRTGRVFTVDLCESSRSECELLQLHDVSITCARLCDSLLLLGDSLGRVFVCELLSTQAGRVFCLDIAANKSAILSIQQHHPQLPDHFNSVEEPIDETEPALHRVNSLDIKAMQAALQATNVDRTAGKALPPASDLQKAAINRLNSDPNLERIGGVSSPLVEPDYVAQSMLGPMQQAVRQTNEEEISRLARDAASRVFVCDADGAVSVIEFVVCLIHFCRQLFFFHSWFFQFTDSGDLSSTYRTRLCGCGRVVPASMLCSGYCFGGDSLVRLSLALVLGPGASALCDCSRVNTTATIVQTTSCPQWHYRYSGLFIFCRMTCPCCMTRNALPRFVAHRTRFLARRVAPQFAAPICAALCCRRAVA
jgi:hypothetical protein